MYWTQCREVAELFAGDDGVLLTGDIPPEAVLFANHGAFEYIIDSRNVDYEIERLDEATALSAAR
jgi:hypothetical protein